MQKDVADKITKKQKNKTSVLSLIVDFMCEEIREITKVWAINFMPPPKVESMVLYFKVRKDINSEIILDFLEIIKLGFSEKRKKLISNLSKRFDKNKISLIFETLEFNHNTRAEDISLDNWIKLVELIKN
ncbi:MAG: dimethyladenosine transferase [uncultured bacterium (gcode 4)]|uniref:Dimethyladenosine transferase n=1 Tax=uncultured bacterium (gcode 4) TaxID=1234023 RepID=K2BD95_9BACT|nr:MAG: dimethyladenosine transferase [uncultured bacterium (gcode 4)]